MKRQVGETGGNAPTRAGRVNTAKGRTPGAPPGVSRQGREISRMRVAEHRAVRYATMHDPLREAQNAKVRRVYT